MNKAFLMQWRARSCLIEVWELGLKILCRGDAVARAERVDLPDQLVLHLRVLGDEVDHRRQRERRRRRPSEEVLVGQRAQVVRREQLPRGRVALPRREQNGQEVLVRLRRRRALPRRHAGGDDAVHHPAELAVHAGDLPVGGAGDPQERLPQRLLQEGHERADDGGERPRQVHLERRGRVDVHVYELRRRLRRSSAAVDSLRIVARRRQLSRQAEVRVERRLPDDVGGEAHRQVGEDDLLAVVEVRRRALDARLHGRDQPREVRLLVDGDDDVPHRRPPRIPADISECNILGDGCVSL
jgi:hypothetical protein